MRCLRILTLFVLLLTTNASGASPKPLTAKGAAELAAKLANAETNRRFDHRPFSASDGEAVFQRDTAGKKRWRWSAKVGFGLGDLSANVSFDQDGSRPFVVVQPAMSMPRESHLIERQPPIVTPER